MQGFDLKKAQDVVQQESEGIVVELTHPNGDVMEYTPNAVDAENPDQTHPVTWTVVGTYSKQYKDAERRQRNKAHKRGFSARRSGDDADEAAIELLAACVLGWEGMFSDGKPLLFSRDNVIAVFKAAPWIREQITVVVQDHARFFEPKSTN